MYWTSSEEFTDAGGEFIPLGQSTWGKWVVKGRSRSVSRGQGWNGQCWQLLEVAAFSQEHAGSGIFLFSVPEGISKVQMAGWSLPMHLFPLISSQGRETPKNQTPSTLLKVRDEMEFLAREELAACEMLLLSVAHFGPAHFRSLWVPLHQLVVFHGGTASV